MTAEQYRQRRAAGICALRKSCTEPAEPGRSFCAACRSIRGEYRRKLRKLRREFGMCARSGCKVRTGGGMCPKHAEVRRRENKAWLRHHPTDYRAKYSRKWRASRFQRGQCHLCSQPVATKSNGRPSRMCERHLLQNREKSRLVNERRRQAKAMPGGGL